MAVLHERKFSHEFHRYMTTVTITVTVRLMDDRGKRFINVWCETGRTGVEIRGNHWGWSWSGFLTSDEFVKYSPTVSGIMKWNNVYLERLPDKVKWFFGIEE